MRAMRTGALAAVVTAAVVAAVMGLSDAMKFHTDSGDPGSRAAITFDARSRDSTPREDPALTLWKECRSHANHVRITSGPVEHDGLWTVTLEPALGTHTERRLVGCLNDLTADGVSGRFVKVERTG